MYIITSDFRSFIRKNSLDEAKKIANERLAGVYISTNGHLDQIHWPE